MKLSLLFRLALLTAALLIGAGFSAFPLSAQELQEDSEQEKALATEEQKATIIQLYSWATILPKELIDLQNEIEKDDSLRNLDKELPNLTAEIDKIRWDTTLAQTNPEIQLPQVSSHQEKAQRFSSRLKKMSNLITSSISSLSVSRKEWRAKKDQVLELEKSEEIGLMMAAEEYQVLLETIELAMSLIEKNLKLALQIGKAIGDMQITLYSIESDLQDLEREMLSISIQQTAPSMLSADFYTRINANLIKQSYNKTRRFIGKRYKILKDNVYAVLLAGIVFFLVCMVVKKTGDFKVPSSRWRPFAQCPFATTVFLAASTSSFFNILPFNTELVQQWEASLHILTLLAVIRLVKYLVPDRMHQKILRRLTFFMVGTLMLLLLGLPHVITLLYVFYASIVALIFYFYRLPSTRGKELSEVWIKWLWGIFPAIILISGISGYDQFAVMIFSTLLSTLIICLVIWMFYLLHLGLLELIFSLLPFSFIKQNVNHIIDGLQPIIAWAHIVILITIQCVIWDLYPTFNKALYGISNLGFDIGGLNISPKFIFTVALVFYGALLASKAIQVLLLNNVLPRYKAERGVQLSIARLVHYATLSIGFLVMLKVLGFQLNQLTLLGGALGVGIGFGLQAIVNNFTSGLILLFERPVKVGDTIQIGTEWGEVKQLGLRATVIQTFDNAEIVVPNSDLITSQVTNWTLADRKVRVKIPIGVAYGSDVSKVMDILVSCGKANPMVLSTPQPVALFLAFGASSLDFELRVWISDFLNKIQVLSELNQDIDYEFSVNNIEIPFPQSDLHLKSVTEEARAGLHGRDCSTFPTIDAEEN